MATNLTPPTSTHELSSLPLSELLERLQRFETALLEICSTQGHVCQDFDLCSHESCASSCSSWFIANKALHPNLYKELSYVGAQAAPPTDAS